jgi:hypothetical protein
MGPIERELVQRYDAIHSNLVDRTRPRNQILIRQAELDQLRWDVFNLKAKVEKLTKKNKELKEDLEISKAKNPKVYPKPLPKLYPISTAKKYPTIKRIKELVAVQEGVSTDDLESPRRHNNIVFTRQIIYYLAKTLTIQSFPAIGREFGNRDHSTVMNGFRKISETSDADPVLKARLDWYRDELLGELNGTPERSDADGTIRRDNLPAAEGPQAAIGAITSSLFCDG